MDDIKNNNIHKAFELINMFDKYGYEAYLVGGAVRDLLNGDLSDDPDIDITTNATPEQIIDIVNINKIDWFQEGKNGRNYGTVNVMYNNIPVQVTPFRTDENYDGRHCECKFVKTLKEDLNRRDFTVNAIALNKDGYPIDHFCGIRDIVLRLIRSIEEPEITYQRDQLRAMRAIRLATTKDFRIEEKTYKALFDVKLDKLSKERIRDELTKILESPNRMIGLQYLDVTGLLKQIIPEIKELENTNQDKINHPEGNVFTHTMYVVKNLPSNSSIELVIAGILHDIAKPIVAKAENDDGSIHFYEHELYGSVMSENILKKLTFKRNIIEKVEWLVANHMRIHHFNEMRKSKKVKLIESEYFDDLLELYRADILGSSGKGLEIISNIYEFRFEYINEKINRPILKERLINGYDIINSGVDPKHQGILIGQILEKIEDEIIEGYPKMEENKITIEYINTKEDAMKRIKQMIEFYNKFKTLEPQIMAL